MAALADSTPTDIKAVLMALEKGAAKKKLVNDPAKVVDEALDGLLLTTPGLRRLDGYTVLVRESIDKSKVALISGGGSGHEPSHGGWVGEGMLTAAVPGEVFASPSTASVLAAILHVTGPAGCLVIVKNYTGDRLNFGLACEQAKATGLNVEMLVIGDDCALPNRTGGLAGRRGIAGTVLVHKVAGAAAEAGMSLAQVTAEATTAAAEVGSMGVALTSCSLPGKPADDRIAPGSMEVGLGIHGEPGAAVAPLATADAVVDELLGTITSRAEGRGYLPIAPGDSVALLVNNLGGCTALELALATRRAVATLEGGSYGVTVARCYVGPFMTALDMVGLSLSLLKLDDGRTARLDAPTSCAAFPRSGALSRAPRVPPPPLPASNAAAAAVGAPAGAPSLSAEQQAATAAALQRAAEAIVAAEPQLTDWDTKAGDGDCGDTLKAGALAMLEDLPGYPLGHPQALLQAVARSLARSMGGSSGALYAIFLNAAAVTMTMAPPPSSPDGAPPPPPTPAEVAAALAAGSAALSRYGGAGAGDRTMLDALLPAASAMKEAAAAGGAMPAALEAAASAGEAGAEATMAMAAEAGRASYVTADVLQGVPDPGAKAVAYWLRALAASAGA